MTARTLRLWLRWLHLGGSGLLGFYLYSPYGDVQWVSFLTLWIVFPAMAVTGIWVWQQGRITRLLGGGGASTAQGST